MYALQRRPLVLAIPLIAVVALVVLLARANFWAAGSGHPARWSSAVVSPDGTRVTVSYTVDGCFGSADAHADEGRDAVTITVLVQDPAGVSCHTSSESR